MKIKVHNSTEAWSEDSRFLSAIDAVDPEDLTERSDWDELAIRWAVETQDILQDEGHEVVSKWEQRQVPLLTWGQEAANAFDKAAAIALDRIRPEIESWAKTLIESIKESELEG